MTAATSSQGGDPSNSGLGRKAVETFGFRAATLPLSFAATVITSRFLLPEGRGAYVIGLLTVTVAATLVGIGTAVTHEIARSRESVSGILAHALVICVALGGAGAALLFSLNAVFAGSDYRAIQLFALGLPPLLLVTAMGGALVGIGRLRLWNSVQLLPPASLLLGLILLVVALDLGVAGAVASWLLAQWIAAIVILAVARDLWTPLALRDLSYRRTGPILGLSAKAGLVNLVALLNYRIELFILERFDGLRAVGIYSVSMSLAELLWLVSATLTTVAVAPAIQQDHDRAVAIVQRSVRHALLLTSLTGAVLGLLGILAIPIIFGEPFAPSVIPLLILIPGVVCYAPASVLSMYFSMRLGRMRHPLIAAFTSAALTAVLCLALVPSMGVRGAAVASAIGYATGSALLASVFVRASGSRARDLIPRPGDMAAYRDVIVSLIGRSR